MSEEVKEQKSSLLGNVKPSKAIIRLAVPATLALLVCIFSVKAMKRIASRNMGK